MVGFASATRSIYQGDDVRFQTLKQVRHTNEENDEGSVANAVGSRQSEKASVYVVIMLEALDR